MTGLKIAALSVGLFSLSAFAQASGEDADLVVFDGTQQPQQQTQVTLQQQPTALEVPTDVQSIQAAIDLIADRGEIRILPGSYTETLHISGKRVKLLGMGTPAPELVGASSNAPVLTFGPGGGGRVQNLSFSGGSAGIAGQAGLNGGELPAPLLLNKVAIGATIRGVSGTFSKLAVVGSEVAFTHWNGLSLEHTQRLLLRRVELHDIGGFGVVSQAAPGLPCEDQTFRWVTVRRSARSGIAIQNMPCKVHLDRVLVEEATEAGIDLLAVGETDIRNTKLGRTRENAAGHWGDGLRVWSTHVTVDRLTSYSNERAGFSAFGCGSAQSASVELTDSGFDCNAFFAEISNRNLLSGATCASGVVLKDPEPGSNLCRSCSLGTLTCKAESTAPTPITVPDL